MATKYLLTFNNTAHKIKNIKTYRSLTHLGLKESKDAIEAVANSPGRSIDSPYSVVVELELAPHFAPTVIAAHAQDNPSFTLVVVQSRPDAVGVWDRFWASGAKRSQINVFGYYDVRTGQNSLLYSDQGDLYLQDVAEISDEGYCVKR